MDKMAHAHHYSRRIILRSLAFQALFLIFHFAYDWWPNGFTAFFSGIDESVFQHMKIGFYAWIVMSAVEMILVKPEAKGDFIVSRLFGAIIAPCIFTMIWYLAAATIGRMPNDIAEIAWANLVILITGFFIESLEDQLGCRPLTKPFKIATIFLVFVAIFLFIRFTGSVPWTDLFTPPVL